MYNEFIVEKEWITQAGLKAQCILVIGSHRCGYVEIPKGHFLHGVERHEDVPNLNLSDGCYGSSLDCCIDVHGGVTFSGYSTDKKWWLGFDCAHYDDGNFRFLTDDFQRFRLVMNPEYSTVRNVHFVRDQCELMASQIVNADIPEQALFRFNRKIKNMTDKFWTLFAPKKMPMFVLPRGTSFY